MSDLEIIRRIKVDEEVLGEKNQTNKQIIISQNQRFRDARQQLEADLKAFKLQPFQSKNKTIKLFITTSFDLQDFSSTPYLALVVETSDKEMPPEQESLIKLEDENQNPEGSTSLNDENATDISALHKGKNQNGDATSSISQAVNNHIQGNYELVNEVRELKIQATNPKLPDEVREEALQNLEVKPDKVRKFEEKELTSASIRASRIKINEQVFEGEGHYDTLTNVNLESPNLDVKLPDVPEVSFEIVASPKSLHEFKAKLLDKSTGLETLTLTFRVGMKNFYEQIQYAIKQNSPFSVTLVVNEDLRNAKSTDILHPLRFEFPFSDEDVLKDVKRNLMSTTQQDIYLPLLNSEEITDGYLD